VGASSGGLANAIEDSDFWFTVGDDTVNPIVSAFQDQEGLPPPSVTFVKDGLGAEVSASFVGDTFTGSRLDSFQLSYTITIPAGETRYLLAFYNHAQFLNESEDVLTEGPFSQITFDNADDFTGAIGNATMAELEAAGLLAELSTSVRALTVNYFMDTDNNGTQDRDEVGFVAVPEVDVSASNELPDRQTAADLQFSQNGDADSASGSIGALFGLFLMSLARRCQRSPTKT
jgi:hypothetical protein